MFELFTWVILPWAVCLITLIVIFRMFYIRYSSKGLLWALIYLFAPVLVSYFVYYQWSASILTGSMGPVHPILYFFFVFLPITMSVSNVLLIILFIYLKKRRIFS